MLTDRYVHPEMGGLWSEESKFDAWREVEIVACEVMAEAGIVPIVAARETRAKETYTIARIDEIEREVKHDVIAFLTHLAEIVGPESRYVHQGLTSSDVLDSCLAVQLVRARWSVRQL
jgi:adenylosuccinate lyase